jgi:preprotein translocase subunit SecA
MGLFDRAKRVIGDPNERELKRLQPAVEEINAWKAEIQQLSDDAVRAKTVDFRAQLDDGADLDDILPEAFAVVREASRRHLEMHHYDVQLIGGIVLHQGKIAEMRTGEGKTVVATLSVYLNALEGDGSHVITVNDYLAKRDARWMGEIYYALGLSIGVLQHQASFLYDPTYDPTRVEDDEEVDDEERQRRAALGDLQFLRPVSRREAYAADITYGTNHEFGFDYLRDNMVVERDRKVQRGLAFAIVDEVDNILIDEARTPLIISGQSGESLDTYQTFAHIVPTLQPEADFTSELKSRTVSLTESGIEKVERALGIDNLFEGENARMTRFLEASMRAQFMFQRDRDYVVRDGQVIIVDEFTGRMMDGRRYSEGLHQAIEAKENVKIEPETMTLATITYQNYFRMYRKLSGMTGTAATESEEFHKIYSLDVVVIPTNVEVERVDEADLIFRSENAKFREVVNEIEHLNATGQPVLVGTGSVEASERLSDMLRRRGVQHNVLNAKQHERESAIVTDAGLKSAVTIATNMAGRGTDIKLGEGVADLGGLAVLGTERHESRRIDNQLRGRSGRQGDPGQSRFFVSFEDPIMKRFTPDWLPGMLEKMGMDDDMPLESGMVGKALEQAQQKVEAYHFDTRKHLVEYDDVINRQREVIYVERDKILYSSDEVEAIALDMVEAEIHGVIGAFAAKGPIDDLDEDEFWNELGGLLPLDDFEESSVAEADFEGVAEALVDYIGGRLDAQKADVGDERMHDVLRLVLLRTIDRLWVQHLTEVDTFRQGVGLQAYGQQDPLVTYKREAFDMFDQLTAGIRNESVRALTRIQINRSPAPATVQALKAASPKRGPRGTAARGRSRRRAVPAAAPTSADADTALPDESGKKLTRQQRRAMARKQVAVGLDSGAASGVGTAAEAVGVQTIVERHGDETDHTNGGASGTPATSGTSSPPKARSNKKRKKRGR